MTQTPALFELIKESADDRLARSCEQLWRYVHWMAEIAKDESEGRLAQQTLDWAEAIAKGERS